MRGIALKIFLSFWLIFAVLIASFAVLPDRGGGLRFTDHVRQIGLVASGLFEEYGEQACANFARVVETRAEIRFVLLDAGSTPVCQAPGVDLGNRPAMEAQAFVPVRGPSGASFVTAAVALPAFMAATGRPPFPYGAVVLAIVVSGIVCFAMARYLAKPLRQVRDASYRLAAGDLHARAGPSVGSRRDEIGDLVRDFDAMAARIEALVHSQTQLLSDISHELRSPLARLNVALELARRKTGPDAAADLNRIELEAERMNELIGRVLALARAESDGATDRPVTLNLADVVRRVVADADYEARRQHKMVELALATAPAVRGNAQLIASAIENVLRNAVRYTPEHTAVEVAVYGNDREAIVTVRDHGPGVPDADIERIFSPFHRVETARNRETGGVGLGLAIARRAIAVHHGSIAADNASDGGLRVTIRVPVQSPTDRPDRD